VRAYTGIANDGLMPQLSILHRDHEIPAQRVIQRRPRPSCASCWKAWSTRRLRRARHGSGLPRCRQDRHGRKNANGSYIEAIHQAVFIGMLPAEHPRLVSTVDDRRPERRRYYGGAVSAPVFRSGQAGAARLLADSADMSPQTPQLQTAGAAAMTAAPEWPLAAGVHPLNAALVSPLRSLLQGYAERYPDWW